MLSVLGACASVLAFNRLVFVDSIVLKTSVLLFGLLVGLIAAWRARERPIYRSFFVCANVSFVILLVEIAVMVVHEIYAIRKGTSDGSEAGIAYILIAGWSIAVLIAWTLWSSLLGSAIAISLKKYCITTPSSLRR